MLRKVGRTKRYSEISFVSIWRKAGSPPSPWSLCGSFSHWTLLPYSLHPMCLHITEALGHSAWHRSVRLGTGDWNTEYPQHLHAYFMKYIYIRLQYFIISSISTASLSTKRCISERKKEPLRNVPNYNFFVVVFKWILFCSVMFKKRALSKRVPLARLIQKFQYYGKNTSFPSENSMGSAVLSNR